MKLTGLHLLLTYQCTFECEHCFVWGSPWQTGTMTLDDIRQILKQAKDNDIKSIYFEGGEPFLYYATLLRGVEMAVDMGFKVGIVSNAYWAQSKEDAIVWLKPFAGLVEDLSISSDLYHFDEQFSLQAKNGQAAAEELGIPLGFISIAQPQEDSAESPVGQLPLGESNIMYRGRAAEVLVQNASSQSWEMYTECPYENLIDPGRIHLDPLGNLHICQGISLGNLFHTPLDQICTSYDPNAHPIVGPLLDGGPAEITRRYDVAHADGYADACHLCYETRKSLRDRFPEILMPDQMYFVPAG